MKSRGVAALAILCLLAAGCSPSEPDGTGSASTSNGSQAASPDAGSVGESAPASSGPAATPAAGEFVNPVLENFPDPDVLQVDDTFYAYATTNFNNLNGQGSNIQLASSADLVTWERLPDALPQLATWSGLTPLFSDVSHSATWAPDVAEVAGRYVMYYTTPAVAVPRPDGRPSQCISVATADEPQGPFVDVSDAPLACQPDLGGSIDGSYFADGDGSPYLVWKNDGNCCGQPTNFWLQALTTDGLGVTGEAVRLEGLDNDHLWEGGVIESPQLVEQDGRYYMFYSGNDFASLDYAVGYATADALAGPYTDAEENPILSTDFDTAARLGLAGPGHQSVFADADGDLWMAYHAWPNTAVGDDQVGRHLWLDELRFQDGRPLIDGPDADPQPVP